MERITYGDWPLGGKVPGGGDQTGQPVGLNNGVRKPAASAWVSWCPSVEGRKQGGQLPAGRAEGGES